MKEYYDSSLIDAENAYIEEKMKRVHDSSNFEDVSPYALLPLDVSLKDPGKQSSDKGNNGKIYDWNWRVNILANGNVVVTLTESSPNAIDFLSKDFVFSFEKIRKALEKFKVVNIYALPNILGHKSRYYQNVMREIAEAIKEESYYVRSPKGILVEIKNEKKELIGVRLNSCYERAVEAVAKWHAVYRAINNHGNYNAPYGGRLYDFGGIIRPTYCEAIPPA